MSEICDGRDPKRCFTCPFRECRIQSKNATRGGITRDIEEALFGAYGPERRAKLEHARYVRDKDKKNAARKKRRKENQATLTEVQACIREAREARGLTQKELADMIGVHQSTLCCWENGIAAANWRRLARFLPELAAKMPAEKKKGALK